MTAYAFDRPVDPYPPLEPVTKCDPTPRPGVEAFRDYVLTVWRGEDWGIVRDCEPGRASSAHNEGRAWDWHAPTPAEADALIAWLLADDPCTSEPHGLARRAGIRNLIWDRRIWIAGQGWGPYGGPGKSPHTDHVHFQFSWAGALGKTSFYLLGDGGQVVAALGGQDALAGPTLDGLSGAPVELLAVRGLGDTSPAFQRKLVAVAVDQGLDPSALAAVISFETGGTFSPTVRAGGLPDGAIGLIQWTDVAATAIGTSKARLSRMTAVEQLDKVRDHYAYAQKVWGKVSSLCDHYLAVYAPALIGDPETKIIPHSAAGYAGNRTLDKDRDGTITIHEACRPVRNIIAAAETKPRIVVSVAPSLAEHLTRIAPLALSTVTVLAGMWARGEL